MNTYFKRITLGVCIFLGLCLYTSVFALDYIPLTTIPGVTVKGTALRTPQNLVLGIYTASIGIASILAVIMVIIGGIKYTTMESFNAKTDAKKQITSAFLGLVLLLGSYLLLRTINKDLVEFDTTLPASGGQGLERLSAEREAINVQIHDLRRSYAAADAKTKTAREEAATLLAEKNTLTARYNIIGDKNSPEAIELARQITSITSRHASKTQEVADLDNAAQKLRRDGLALIYTQQIRTELSEGNFDMANNAHQRLVNLQQQRIDQLKKQGAPQEEIQKAEANKSYITTKNSTNILLAQALGEISRQTGFIDKSKVAELKTQIAAETNRARVFISSIDAAKAEALRTEALANIKKIDDALDKRENCPLQQGKWQGVKC